MNQNKMVSRLTVIMSPKNIERFSLKVVLCNIKEIRNYK